LKEAEKLGFGSAVLPSGSGELAGGIGAGSFQPTELADLVARIAGSRRSRVDEED
ncbi:DNA repair protein RadA, partial [Mesorhizobium sp. M7A.F.Ca.US.002.01.1.1]